MRGYMLENLEAGGFLITYNNRPKYIVENIPSCNMRIVLRYFTKQGDITKEDKALIKANIRAALPGVKTKKYHLFD